MSEKTSISTPKAAPANEHLIWVDMEMSGLDPEKERILEIAMIVTDAHLNTIATAPVWVIRQEDALLDAMDAWNKATHGRSGLIDKVKTSTTDEATAEAQCITFLKQYIKPGIAPMCGNTIGQDRRFMAKYMPKLEAFFHYRNIDVSTLKELCKRWHPELVKGFNKKQAHTALADIEESIEELKYYREKFIVPLPE
ncbi:oligoribonuclease [Polynucleobacter sp. JS-Mosq-20-D10]|uniref:oligoribonuclease n=1 Tax=Polynucleobacter sp. JS-Mosq-20-D10 TaxID=2576922 RepID=UPI001BFD588E|nr:oligoribonuclease [Polynucleobacter sp. JS-Mosq-20-D10]QWD99963.1 oligoribonuclease [Polynucleobacter sp. JS-Mosq-20-D10]